MATQKNYYYVGVQTERGMQLVTNLEYETRSARWKADEKPLKMTKAQAEDIRFGLCMNFYFAVIINCHFELDRQYFIANE